MSTITIQDLNTTVNHEPRILDIRLAEALGFSQERDIRKIIMRSKEHLERLGTVCATVAQTSVKGGRPATEYYLNEKQALFLCTKSEAENAIDITIQMVEVFYAHKHGLTEQKQPVEHQITFSEAAGQHWILRGGEAPLEIGRAIVRIEALTHIADHIPESNTKAWGNMVKDMLKDVLNRLVMSQKDIQALETSKAFQELDAYAKKLLAQRR